MDSPLCGLANITGSHPGAKISFIAFTCVAANFILCVVFMICAIAKKIRFHLPNFSVQVYFFDKNWYMADIDIIDVATRVSSEIRNYYPGKLIKANLTTNEMEFIYSNDEVKTWQDFWEEAEIVGGSGRGAVSDEKKREIYWKFQRSSGCQSIVASLATVIKDLTDSGANLTYNGCKVENVMVLNSTEFDVSDLVDSQLILVESKSQTKLPIMSTYKAMTDLSALPRNVQADFGLMAPVPSKLEQDQLAKGYRCHYGKAEEVVPHWWLGLWMGKEHAGSQIHNPRHKIVHIDLCGVAYDAGQFRSADPGEEEVPLHVFDSPKFRIFPGDYTHKFRLASVTVENIVPPWTTRFGISGLSTKSGVWVQHVSRISWIANTTDVQILL